MGIRSSYAQNYFSTISVLDSVGYNLNDVVEVDKNYYTTGHAATINNEIFMSVAKYDSLGNEVWVKWFGDSNTTKWVFSERILAGDTSIYVFGAVYDSVGSRDIYIYQFDLDGNKINYIRIANPNKEEAPRHIIRTLDRGFVVVGEATELNTVFSDSYVFKLNENLSLEWEYRYGLNGLDEWGAGISECSDGGFLVSGRRWNVPNWNADKWLFKVDSNGVFLWDTLWGDPLEIEINGEIIRTSMQTNVLVGGTFYVPSLDHKIELFSFDDNGVEIWSKNYQLTNKAWAYYGGVQNEDGTLIFYGQSKNSNDKQEVFILKTTPRGDTIWSRNYTANPNEHNYIGGMIPSSFGGYVFVGSTVTNSQDAWIKKIDCMGCDSISCYYPDSCYVYNCSEDYPPIANFTLAQDTIYWVDTTTVQFTNSSNSCAGYTWFFGTGDSLNLVNPSYTFTQPGTYPITLVGRNVTCTDTAKATLYILPDTTVGVSVLVTESVGIELFPNPFNETFHIVISYPKGLIQSGKQMRNLPLLKSENIKMYNVFGKKVDFSFTLGMANRSGKVVINAKSLPSGIYFIEITTDEFVYREKVVKN